MPRKIISTILDSKNIQSMNDNFTELYNNRNDITNDALAQVEDRFQAFMTKHDARFLPPVANVADRDSTYLQPKQGDIVTVLDDGTGNAVVYRYDAGAWVATDKISSTVYADLSVQLQAKVDKELGKGLSANDFTTPEKQKLAGVEDGANKYTHPDTHSADMITTSASKRFTSDAEMNGKANKEQEFWIPVVPENGWTTTSAPLRYFKDNFGIVELSGELKDGVATTGTVLCTLPIGYRPIQTVRFPAIKANDGTLVTATITTAGAVLIAVMNSTGTIGINVSFRAV